MVFAGIKVFLVVLIAPILVMLLFVYGLCKRNGKLKALSDEKMVSRILSNFNISNFKIKILLCMFISYTYSLLLAGDRKTGNFMFKISTSRDLTKFLIILLIVEQLIATRGHAKKHYSDRESRHA
jgi:hypothetical protein